MVFHTHPRILLTFSLNVQRISFEDCIATKCDSLPPHAHYSDEILHTLEDLISKSIFMAFICRTCNIINLFYCSLPSNK